MPTILRIDGYRFYFYSDEGNEPPHVHVEKNAGRDKAYALIELHQEGFKTAWNEYFNN